MLKRDVRAGGHSPLFLPTLFLRSRHLLEIGTRASRPSKRVLGRKSSEGSSGNKSGERTSASIKKSSEGSAGNQVQRERWQRSPANERIGRWQWKAQRTLAADYDGESKTSKRMLAVGDDVDEKQKDQQTDAGCLRGSHREREEEEGGDCKKNTESVPYFWVVQSERIRVLVAQKESPASGL